MAEHWCKEHKTVFFKKGKMKNYAHPIVDEEGEPTGEWCNESKEEDGDHFLAHNVPLETGMTKGDWAEKDKITRKSIERQTSLNAAIELAKIKGADDAKRVLATAIFFEYYLETGKSPVHEVQKAESKLVQEIKKLGAEEIKGKEEKN